MSLALLSLWLALLGAVIVGCWREATWVEVLAPNEPDPAQLPGVMEDMRTLGPPRLRAVRVSGCWIALEGSHRLAAASALGVPVDLVVLPADADLDDHDLLAEDGQPLPSPMPVWEAAALVASWGGPVHRLPLLRVRLPHAARRPITKT